MLPHNYGYLYFSQEHPTAERLLPQPQQHHWHLGQHLLQVCEWPKVISMWYSSQIYRFQLSHEILDGVDQTGQSVGTCYFSKIMALNGFNDLQMLLSLGRLLTVNEVTTPHNNLYLNIFRSADYNCKAKHQIPSNSRTLDPANTNPCPETTLW